MRQRLSQLYHHGYFIICCLFVLIVVLFIFWMIAHTASEKQRHRYDLLATQAQSISHALEHTIDSAFSNLSTLGRMFHSTDSSHWQGLLDSELLTPRAENTVFLWHRLFAFRPSHPLMHSPVAHFEQRFLHHTFATQQRRFHHHWLLPYSTSPRLLMTGHNVYTADGHFISLAGVLDLSLLQRFFSPAMPGPAATPRVLLLDDMYDVRFHSHPVDSFAADHNALKQLLSTHGSSGAFRHLTPHPSMTQEVHYFSYRLSDYPYTVLIEFDAPAPFAFGLFSSPVFYSGIALALCCVLLILFFRQFFTARLLRFVQSVQHWFADDSQTLAPPRLFFEVDRLSDQFATLRQVLHEEQLQHSLTQEKLRVVGLAEQAKSCFLTQVYTLFPYTIDSPDASVESHLEEVDVRDVIESSIVIQKKEAMERNIALDTKLPATVPSWIGNSCHLQQIVTSTLFHSIAFARPGAAVMLEMTVTRATTSAPDSMNIIVTDNGFGLDEHSRQQLLHGDPSTKDAKPWAAADATKSPIEAIRYLAKLYHGAFCLKSDFSFGSVFTITLPYLAQEDFFTTGSKHSKAPKKNQGNVVSLTRKRASKR